MVCAVQNAPPEDPDAGPRHVEERADVQPPGFRLSGHKGQTRFRKLDQPLGARVNRDYRRHDLVWRRLGHTQELAEKTPAG